jgi:transglutaminase-like putative cysteine protease
VQTSIALRHHTEYRYDGPVVLGPQTIRLRPSPHTRIPIRSYALTIRPEAHYENRYQDPAGNFLVRASFSEPTSRLDLTVELTADLADMNPFDFVVEPEAATWPFDYPALLAEDLAPYLKVAPAQPLLVALLADMPREAQPTVDMLMRLNRLVQSRVAYARRMEPGVHSSDETLELGSGSCRDSAWLLVQSARSLGYAARFVSGYLIQLADREKLAAGLEVDTADLHAWAEIYLPGAGWIGFDSTSGLMTSAGHIPLACSASPASAAPVSGTLGVSKANLTVDMSVVRLAPCRSEFPVGGIHVLHDHPSS